MKKIRKKILDFSKYKKNKNGNIGINELQERLNEKETLIKLETKRSTGKKLLRREIKELSRIIKKENLKNLNS